jgi:sugar transferase (PEP-CTERM/EpsH1 system associated)
MQIIFLTQLLPYPLDSGGKIKCYHFLRVLATKHHVTLLSFVRSREEAEYAQNLAQFCDRVETCILKRSLLRDIACFVKSRLTRQSFIMTRDRSTEFESRLRDLVREHRYDVIHAVRLNMFQYVPAEGSSCTTVLDTENVEFLVLRRIFQSDPLSVSGLVSLLESKRLADYERAACSRADFVLTVTDEDKSALTRLAPNSARETRAPRLETIPIGVDTSYFTRSWQMAEEPRAVFVGTMYWPPNVDSVIHFCDDILPIVRSELPELEFNIVGLRPTKAVLNLQSTVPGVHVVGSVPDVRPYMAESRVFVVPLRAGSGMRVKILNAMAVGIPVVTTSIGCEGIDGLVQVQRPLADHDNSDANIWVADSPHEFARAVVTLVTHDGIARTLSRNGRTLMETVYDWSIIRNRILDLYDRIEQEMPSRQVTRMPADGT